MLNSALLLIAPGRGYNAYFRMPFRRHCRITVENRSKEAKDLYYSISGSYEEIPDDALYFHACYRQEHPVQKGRSYTVVDEIKEKGQFLGLTLAAGMNGNNTCWVEGEARMYIDNDRYPSMHYTGTEDYFGGAYVFGNDICQKEYLIALGVVRVLASATSASLHNGSTILIGQYSVTDLGKDDHRRLSAVPGSALLTR